MVDQIEEASDLIVFITQSDAILLSGVFLSNLSRLFEFTLLKMALNHFTISDWLTSFPWCKEDLTWSLWLSSGSSFKHLIGGLDDVSNKAYEDAEAKAK